MCSYITIYSTNMEVVSIFFYPRKQCLNKMPTREPLPLERNPEKRPCWLSGPACTKGQGHGLYWFTGPRLPSVCGTQTVVITVSSTAPCKAVGPGLRCRHSQSIWQLLDPRGSSPSWAGLQPPTEGHWTGVSRWGSKTGQRGGRPAWHIWTGRTWQLPRRKTSHSISLFPSEHQAQPNPALNEAVATQPPTPTSRLFPQHQPSFHIARNTESVPPALRWKSSTRRQLLGCFISNNLSELF